MHRNSYLVVAGIFLFVFLFSAVTAQAKVDYQLDYASRYIWRGFDLNPNNQFVIQPSANYQFPNSNWSVNAWMSLSKKDKDLNELDLTFNYDFPVTGSIAVSAGLIHYGWYWAKDFSHKKNTSMETYVTLAWQNCDLNPEISLYQDFKNGNGFYGQLKLSKEIKLSKSNNMEISSSIGYNQKQWVSASGFSDFNMTLAFPMTSGKFTFTPFYSHTWVLLKEVNPGKAHEHWVGLSVAF